MNNNVLVIAAHPDDELLGCGGTLAKHHSEGDTITSCIVCEGESIRNISQKEGRFIKRALRQASIESPRSQKSMLAQT